MAVVFGWDGVGVGPEATAVFPRFGFGRGVDGVVVVALVVMRQTGAEHFKIDVRRADEDCAEDAPVFVAALVFDADIPAEDERRKTLLRLLPEGLVGFGSVDSVEADLVLGGSGFGIVPSRSDGTPWIRREDCYGVAVGDADNAASE